MKIIKGDLIKLAQDGQFDVIIHGCNCFHTMGSGIAKQIKEAFPGAYEADLNCFPKGDIRKLGNASCRTECLPNGKTLRIVNAYVQYNYGCDKQRYVDYCAVMSCFRKLKEYHGNRGLKFGYPKIGAGLGGGDWNLIAKIIDQELEGEDHTLVLL